MNYACFIFLHIWLKNMYSLPYTLLQENFFQNIAMSDYLDLGRFAIREWRGERRVFTAEEGPLRPRRAHLTTTLEAAYSSAEDGPGGDHSCIFRKDN